MTEVTLADYTGYIFREIIRAREMADRHSRALAEVYAADPVLQHFSIPRFKVPKVELTIPMMISGARFNQVLTFKMSRDRFVSYVDTRLLAAMSALRAGRLHSLVRRPASSVSKAQGRRPAPNARGLGIDVGQFHQALTDNPDPSQPGNIVEEYWATLFEQSLITHKLTDAYKQANPNDELFRQTFDDVLRTIVTNTVVDSTAIQSLLINPETNIVKNGSSESSVFTVKAELIEEGFFLRHIKDEDTGLSRPIVEFD